MQIIVLGMHRSGTSVVTRLINMMGAYFGEEGDSIGQNEFNPKGFWERMDTLLLNDKLLAASNAAWDDVARWNPPAQLPQELTGEIQRIVALMDAHQPWVLKDPRMCMTLPFWKPHLSKPVAVIVYRDALEVAESLHIRDRIPIAVGLALWEAYWVSALNAAMDMPKLFVHHHEVLKDPVATVKRVYAELQAAGVSGLSLPPEAAITEFVDPALYRSVPVAAKGARLSSYQEDIQPFASGQASIHKTLQFSDQGRSYLDIYPYVLEEREKLKETENKQRELQHHIGGLEQWVLELRKTIEERDVQVANLQQQLNDTHSRLHDTIQHLQKVSEELHGVYSSKSWKIGNFLARLYRRIIP